jgi:5-methylcytosine-specific restriction endonuclease McrA
MNFMEREPVEETKRAPFTKAQKVAILAKSDGHCAYPGCFQTEGLEFDHVVARWLGGAHSVENAQALCEAHHTAKTALDAKIRARTKRLIKREAGEKKPTTMRSRGFAPGKRTIPSRPFPKRKQ